METTMTPEAFNTALATFVRLTQEAKRADMDLNYPGTSRESNLYTYSVQMGRRYARIVVQTGRNPQGGSVHCFVDTTNGDILKADGWKKPAKGARGNIFNIDPRQLGGHYYR